MSNSTERPDTKNAAAHRLAGQGWQLFPCQWVMENGVCSCIDGAKCKSPGKHPLVREGFRVATTDPEQIDEWWGSWPEANVAMATGHVSGLVVVDIDPRHDGTATMKALTDEHGKLPDGIRVRTGSDGWHLYYAHPGPALPNSANRIGQGVDVRGDGGYVLMPPSNHVQGIYRWDNPKRFRGLPEMPAWLLDLATPPPPPERKPFVWQQPTDNNRKWAEGALRGECERLQQQAEGGRNDALNKAAFAVGQIVGAGLLDDWRAEAALTDAGIAVGLGETEVRKTVQSGLSHGERFPRSPDDK